MTTISPARIKRIWAACPELRPFQMTDLCGSVTIGDATLTLFPDFAHALIRDKIVWWLADCDTKDCKSMCVEKNEDLYFVDVVDFVEEDGIGPSNDPTVACVRAAERVLGLPEWKE